MKPVRTIGIVKGPPGPNPVTRAVVRSAISQYNLRGIGIRNGFDGLIWPEGAKEISVTLDEALEKMKYVDPRCEVVHAARAVGATFGDSA